MEPKLSKTCIPFPRIRILKMTNDEILALQRFKAQYEISFEPLLVINLLKKYDYISQSEFTYLMRIFRDQSREDNLQLLILNIPYYCSFNGLQHALFSSGNENVCALLTKTLYLVRLESKVWRIYRTNCENREQIHIFFKDLKRMVHDATFKNPRDYLRIMAKRFKVKLTDSEKVQGNERRSQGIADKYIALLGAEIDAHAITFDDHLPQHDLFKELDSLTVHSSNTVLTNVIYFGRLANAYAIAHQFDQCYDMLRIAQCYAATCGPSLELANMHYIDVYVKLWEYEYNPNENLRKELLKAGWFGLCSLENEVNEDIKRLWRRMFILRMAFCLLGIGNRANVFMTTKISIESIDEANKLLHEVDKLWEGIETRREMFYYVARARLNSLTGNGELAKEYISRARKCATDGRFKELRFIREYQKELINNVQIELGNPCEGSSQEILHSRGVRSAFLNLLPSESSDFHEIPITNSREESGNSTENETELKVFRMDMHNPFFDQVAEDARSNTHSKEGLNRENCQQVNVVTDSTKTVYHGERDSNGLPCQIDLHSFKYDDISQHFTQLMTLDDTSREEILKMTA